MDAWDIDIVLAASQKGLGAPPGLSILVASERAMKVFEARKTPPTSYYASWKKWLPIMKAYEAGKPAYFGTPPVNLIRAFHASLTQLTKTRHLQMEDRFNAHKKASARVRAIAAQLGMQTVARSEKESANGMTAVYYPEGVGASDILPRLAERGVILAGGLHSQIKDQYFRIGHMGVSVTNPERGDVDTLTTSLAEAVRDARASKAKASEVKQTPTSGLGVGSLSQTASISAASRR
ncbi:hypothetical protein HGRIS_004709 [Hohenbuehelia grisea]|uniref:Aminotransferase class V domain-containing protein n=1 Tax=Hohenbuehelia grisea TaxID=104357 RepID=A0ABR3JCP0_9AGAR